MGDKTKDLIKKIEEMNGELDAINGENVDSLIAYGELLETVGKPRAAKKVQSAAKILVDLANCRYMPEPRTRKTGNAEVIDYESNVNEG